MEIKKILLPICLSLMAQTAISQSLGQDAEGKSTVVAPTTTINLDIANNIASFTFYRKYEDDPEVSLKNKPSPNCITHIANDKNFAGCIAGNMEAFMNSAKYQGIILGIDLKGSVKDGIGTLFASEKITTTSSVGFLIGRYWSRTNYKRKGLAGIIAIEKDKINSDSALQAEVAKITPTLLAKISLLSGMSMDRLNPKTPPKTFEEKVNFYDNLLHETAYGEKVKEKFEREKIEYEIKKEQLNDLKATVNKSVSIFTALPKYDDSIAAVAQKQDMIEQLGQITGSGSDAAKLEIAQLKKDIIALQLVIDTILDTGNTRLDIFKNYDLYKTVYPTIMTTGIIEKPFVKKVWTDNLKIIDEQLKQIDLQIRSADAKVKNDYSNDPEYVVFKNAITQILNYYVNARDKYVNNNVKTEGDYLFRSTGMVFFRGSFNGSDFRYDLANGEDTIDERFVDKTFNGYTLELGYNYNFKAYHYLGLSGSFSYTNNLNALTSTKYKLDKTEPLITDGKFSSSEEVTALSGPFDTFLRYDLNADYVWLLPLREEPEKHSQKESHLYLSINPYLRHRIYQNAENLKNNTILGLGLHVYNSKDNKVMGGVFVQSNDVFGVHVPDGEDSNLGKRISFGIIAKFAFSGLKLPKE